MSRLDTIRALAAEHDADAAIVTHPPSLRWALGFTGSNGLLIVTPDAAHFVTDGRYTSQAATEVTDADVHVAPASLAVYASEHRLLGAVKRVVVAGDHLTVSAHRKLGEALSVELVAVDALLSRAVAQKDEAAIAAVAAAQALTCEVFESILPSLAPGVTEQAIAAEVVYQHLKRGASAMSFEPIVASGPRGALPHARPSSRTLAPGDLVVLDMGGVLDGYCSDLTRTVAVGEPGQEARTAYAVVQQAQRSAIEAARAGITGKDLDAVARDVIQAAGLGDAFSHSLGHGVGLEVHEWPRVSAQADDTLPAGATITIEPGVYLDGQFGIRIENVIVLREDGCDDLTPLSTDLVVV
ncbi:aminopeptidase P family protein [Rubrivirga sp. IMCC43871]|uniref:aminopeptidase P family protein n=1 Tax=Rubrivirga sp. IMCC43871 TaxID=3391575 RepID=UPI00399038D1